MDEKAPEATTAPAEEGTRVGVRCHCFNTRDGKHRWKLNKKFSEKLRGYPGYVMQFYCIFCQVIKHKIVLYEGLGAKLRSVCKEEFPGGQIVNEPVPGAQLSEREVYDVDDHGVGTRTE